MRRIQPGDRALYIRMVQEDVYKRQVFTQAQYETRVQALSEMMDNNN